MAWEIVAIWAIVIGTLIWFRRDEDRLRSRKLAAQARYFATAAPYRHRQKPAALTNGPVPPQAQVHRRYLDAIRAKRDSAVMAPQR